MWEISALPAPPYDLRVTDVYGRVIVLRRAIIRAGALGEFNGHGQFKGLGNGTLIKPVNMSILAMPNTVPAVPAVAPAATPKPATAPVPAAAAAAKPSAEEAPVAPVVAPKVASAKPAAVPTPIKSERRRQLRAMQVRRRQLLAATESRVQAKE